MSKLNFLNGWAGVNSYLLRRSAQSFMGTNQMAFAVSGCGSSCGAGDDGKQNPPASACGAGDDQPTKPSSCGSGCGTGDDK